MAGSFSDRIRDYILMQTKDEANDARWFACGLEIGIVLADEHPKWAAAFTSTIPAAIQEAGREWAREIIRDLPID